jgi:hypothetical protein
VGSAVSRPGTFVDGRPVHVVTRGAAARQTAPRGNRQGESGLTWRGYQFGRVVGHRAAARVGRLAARHCRRLCDGIRTPPGYLRPAGGTRGSPRRLLERRGKAVYAFATYDGPPRPRRTAGTAAELTTQALYDDAWQSSVELSVPPTACAGASDWAAMTLWCRPTVTRVYGRDRPTAVVRGCRSPATYRAGALGHDQRWSSDGCDRTRGRVKLGPSHRNSVVASCRTIAVRASDFDRTTSPSVRISQRAWCSLEAHFQATPEVSRRVPRSAA